MNEKLSASRLGGWLAVAMSGPFVYLAGRQSWTSILAVSAVCLAASVAVFARPTHKILSNPFVCLLEYGFVLAACVAVSRWPASIWPTGKAWPAVPLTLLLLATASAWCGAGRAAKGAGVLFWLITILYSVLLTFGAPNIQPAYLLPKWENPGVVYWFVFLIPCAAQFLPREKGKGMYGYIAALAGLAVLLAVWTEGNLSLNAAKQVSWPFYEAGESVHLFAVASRLESFISVGATVGFYSLLGLLLSIAWHLAEGVKKGWGRFGTLAVAAASGAGVLLRWQIPYFVLAIGAFVLWVGLPILGSIFSEKNSEKTKKSA